MNREELLELITSRADHITSALAATGKTIDFRDTDLRPDIGSQGDRGGAFLDFAAEKATIWSANGQALHQVFHVLLHLHRYWVEDVAQLWHQQNGCTGALSSIEAAYEHLVVVPVEIAHYPEAFSYWVNYAEEKLFQCQEKGVSPASLKSQLFRLYLLAQTAFPRSQIADSISVEVWKQALMDEFEEMADIVFRNFEHKAFVLENMCLYLGIVDFADIGLRWIETTPARGNSDFQWRSLSELQLEPQTAEGAALGASSFASDSEINAGATAYASNRRRGHSMKLELPAGTIAKHGKPDLATALSRSPLTGQTAEEKAKILPRMGFASR